MMPERENEAGEEAQSHLQRCLLLVRRGVHTCGEEMGWGQFLHSNGKKEDVQGSGQEYC